MTEKASRGAPKRFRELGILMAAIAGGLMVFSYIKSPAPAPSSVPTASAVPAKPKIETVTAKTTQVPAHVQDEAAKLDARYAASGLEPQKTPPATAGATPLVTVQQKLVPNGAQPSVQHESGSPAAPRPTLEARTESKTETNAARQVSPSLSAQAQKASMKIQHIKSPGGVEAWLVEEHSVPLLALRFVFEGGSSQDPAGKEGIANFMTAMMDEGAGDYDHMKFQERQEELAFKMSFEDSRDAFYGSFETLTSNRQPSLDMLRLALTKPLFENTAVDRIKKQLLASLAFAAKSPDKVAAKTWSATAFPNHPYGRPAEGTQDSIASITRDDLEAYRRRVFARDTLKVVVVGDITSAELGSMLDHVFGELPAKSDLIPVPATKPTPAEKLKVVEMDVPQSVVQFGMNGIARKDPDFLPAFVLNQILGGGGFASRLTEEVREKRGLAYSVYSYLQPYRHVAIFGGGVATKNEEVAQSIEVIRSEFKRMADEGPTPAELANAKSYLTGSFALRFDTNAKIANQLLWMLQEDMGIDYVERRNDLVNAVTMDDVKRAAQRLLKVDDLITTVVGKPQGLSRAGQ